MFTRGQVIAALLVVELAIVGEVVVAIRGDRPAQSSEQHFSVGDRLADGGAHEILDAGAHPTLTVDIGYADLTIVTHHDSKIDVSVSKDSDFAFMGGRRPITMSKDGETIRIAANGGPGWSMGDDRMVTVLVPAETEVTVVRAGDIKAKGLRAEASFRSTGSGTLSVEDFDAPALHVASHNGRISLHGIVAPRFEASSSNGRIEATGLNVRDGSVESDDRVSLGFAPAASTLVTADSDSGSVNTAGITAAAIVPAQHKRSKEIDENAAAQTVRIGAGAGHLDVHTSDGNINLTQES